MLRFGNGRLGKSARNSLLGMEALEQRKLLSGTPPTVTGVFVGSTEWSSAFYDYLAPGDQLDLGYQIPTGTTAQVKSLPWVNIDKIAIRFSEDVHVGMGDLSLSGVNAVAFAF